MPHYSVCTASCIAPVQCVYCIMQCPSTVCVLLHAMPQYSVCTASCNAPVQCVYCIMQCPSTVCVLHHAMPQYSVCTASCNAPVQCVYCFMQCPSTVCVLLHAMHCLHACSVPVVLRDTLVLVRIKIKTLCFRCVTPLSCDVIMFLAHIKCMVLVCY